MPSISPRDIVQRYAPSVVRVTVKNAQGDLATGAGFHIGGGYLVTARHVVDGHHIEQVVGSSMTSVVIRSVHFHGNPKVDLAVMESDFSLDHGKRPATRAEDPASPSTANYIGLGGHLDDWVGDEFLLSKCVLMGFPPIPRAHGAVLVAVEAEVNAIIDRYDGPHPHFIISAIPRGGFSGGPVFSEWGFLLGVMTESVHGDQPSELGFAAVISIEPLLVMLHDLGIECGDNSKWVNDLLGPRGRPQE